MATLAIRNLDEKVKRKLQVRAALNGRSMEAQVRTILTAAAEGGPAAVVADEGLGTAIHKLFAPLGGMELETPTHRESTRSVPTFEE
jgi:plasmid stability protein